MGLSYSECRERSMATLKGMCTFWGLEKPEKMSEKALIEACCTVDVLPLGDLSDKGIKGKVVQLNDEPKMFRAEYIKDGKNMKDYVKCKKMSWYDIEENNRKFGAVAGYDCKVIECTDDECTRPFKQDAVTIKKFTKGFSTSLVKLSPLNEHRKIWESL